jgi:hypothetical protein
VLLLVRLCVDVLEPEEVPVRVFVLVLLLVRLCVDVPEPVPVGVAVAEQPNVLAAMMAFVSDTHFG